MPVKQGSAIRKSGRVFGQGQKNAKMVRAGLYARVSTQDQQTLPMQNRAMREYAARRAWTVAMQLKEVGSGGAQRQRRDEMMEAARRRDADGWLRLPAVLALCVGRVPQGTGVKGYVSRGGAAPRET